ncbi:MAG: hypothetical protein AMXMBFR64_26950 [Myxococcales bacterium]
MRILRWSAVCVVSLALAACGDSDGTEGGAGDTAGADGSAEQDSGGGDPGGDDGGSGDTGSSDAGPSDAGPSDAGPSDAGPEDAGTPDGGPGDAGGDPDPFGDVVTELPLSIAVDETIEPQVETWPALTEDGEPRPVAGIVGHGGRVSSFVADELILLYTDPAERDAFVAKWSGEILLELDPAAKGLPDVPNMALVRVDASAADIDDFIPAVRELEPSASGAYAVSSEPALRLLTAAVTENAAGAIVGVNWIGESTAILNRDVEESATSMSIGSYSPNPFNWNYMRAGSTQNIGVTEAWRALILEEKLGNRVKLAVLDGGFAPDADFPPDYQADSVIAWKSPTNSTNPTWCSGGATCDYHGTSVMHTAAAQVDNGFGTAGTGGPVVDGISVVTIPDSITSTAALIEARDRGAQIINMSFSMTVPSILGGTIAPQEITTKALAKAGIMIFAAAGNDGESVDSEECFSVCVPFTSYCWKECFETYWHAPCENEGVVCIGGLASNQKTRATNSNFGLEHVRLFAPYTVFVGAVPDNSDPIRAINGTSFSSPFVAGVAALVKAADPDLTAKQVIDILVETAHGSPDPVVPGYVNALGAVQAALGNVRPTIRILAPADGTTYGAMGPEGITLVATSEDYEDGIDAVSVEWEAIPGGSLGAGHVRNVLFTTPGFRTVNAIATDSGGKKSVASIQIEVMNEPPSLAISGPFWPETVTVGVPFSVAANTWDPESFSELPCGSVSWEFQKANAPVWDSLGTGCSKSLTLPTPESYSVRVTATDGAGAKAVKVGQMKANPLPASGPPFVAIIAPTGGISVEPLKVLTLVGTAVDPDDPQGLAPLTFEWTGKQTGGSTFPIGSLPIVQWTPVNDVSSSCGPKSVELTLTVTDAGGEITTKKVSVSVFYPPC